MCSTLVINLDPNSSPPTIPETTQKEKKGNRAGEISPLRQEASNPSEPESLFYQNKQ